MLKNDFFPPTGYMLCTVLCYEKEKNLSVDQIKNNNNNNK